MNTLVFEFNGKSITFTVDKENTVMVNATEMARAFDKDLYKYTKSDATKEFIESCMKPEFAGKLGITKEVELIFSRQNVGTFMHRVVALNFATWLNPDFAVWVFITIDSLLFGKYIEREKSFERTIAMQREMEVLSKKQDKTGIDFDRYLLLEKDIKKEQSIRKNLTKESIQEMGDLFEIRIQT